YLATIRAQNTSYNWYEALNKLNKKMLEWAFSRNYISSIVIMDTQGNQYAWGKDVIKIPQTRIEFICERAIEKKGRSVWIEPYSSDSSIVAARAIRSIPDLQLTNVGILIIRMDPEKLFDESSDQRLINKYDSNLAILSENGLIYQRYNQLDSSELASEMDEKAGYFISNIKGRKYLV